MPTSPGWKSVSFVTLQAARVPPPPCACACPPANGGGRHSATSKAVQRTASCAARVRAAPCSRVPRPILPRGNRGCADRRRRQFWWSCGPVPSPLAVSKLFSIRETPRGMMHAARQCKPVRGHAVTAGGKGQRSQSVCGCRLHPTAHRTPHGQREGGCVVGWGGLGRGGAREGGDAWGGKGDAASWAVGRGGEREREREREEPRLPRASQTWEVREPCPHWGTPIHDQSQHDCELMYARNAGARKKMTAMTTTVSLRRSRGVATKASTPRTRSCRRLAMLSYCSCD